MAETVGFIGLGLMGGNMVENLINRGYDLTIMDLNQDVVDGFVAKGAKQAASAKELAANSRPG